MGSCLWDWFSCCLGLVPLTGVGMDPIFLVAPKGCFPVPGVTLSPVPVATPLSELWVLGFSGHFAAKLPPWITAQTNSVAPSGVFRDPFGLPIACSSVEDKSCLSAISSGDVQGSQWVVLLIAAQSILSFFSTWAWRPELWGAWEGLGW